MSEPWPNEIGPGRLGGFGSACTQSGPQKAFKTMRSRGKIQEGTPSQNPPVCTSTRAEANLDVVLAALDAITQMCMDSSVGIAEPQTTCMLSCTAASS